MQVLHRLDMDTTGVVLFAKTPEAARHVHAQFRERTVRKRYMAITLGGGTAARLPPPAHDGGACSTPLADSGHDLAASGEAEWLMDAPLARHPSVAEAACVSAEGRPASTHVRRLAASEAWVWHSAEQGIVWSQPRDTALQGAALFECQPHTGAPHRPYNAGVLCLHVQPLPV